MMIFIFLIIILFSNICFAQTRYGGDFVAVTYNYPAEYVNPAQLIDIDRRKIILDYNSFNDIEGIYKYSGGIYSRFDNFITGVVFNKISADLEYGENGNKNDFSDNCLKINSALDLSRYGSFGIAISRGWLYSNQEIISSINLCLGAIYQLSLIKNYNLNIGVAFINLFTTERYTGNIDSLKFGLSQIIPYDEGFVRIFFDYDFNSIIEDSNKSNSLGVAGEVCFVIKEDFLSFISVGYLENVGFGFGVFYKFMQVDFAWNLDEIIGSTFTLNASFSI